MQELIINFVWYFDLKFAHLWKQMPHNGFQDNAEQVWCNCKSAAFLKSVVCDNGVGGQLYPNGE